MLIKFSLWRKNNWFHHVICVKSHSNLHQITLQSASEQHVTWRRLQGSPTWIVLPSHNEEHSEGLRVQSHRKRAGTKKGAPGTLYPRSSGWKEAATYSPALHCSTIGASGLNFSVRNGKRWDPTAITTWCLVFSWLVCSWQVDKLFVSFAAVITSSNLFTCLLVYS